MSQPYSFIHRLGCAFRGIITCVREERHIKIHLLALVLVVVAGFWFALSAWEWAAVLLVSGLVISLEIVNSGMERALDHLHPGWHPSIGMAKDMMAGAVLVAAAVAVIIGFLVFWPYILEVIQ